MCIPEIWSIRRPAARVHGIGRVLLNDLPCSHSPADDPATRGVRRHPTGSVRSVRAGNAESDHPCASRWSVIGLSS